MDYLKHNRAAWDKEVDSGNTWTIPVSAEAIARARQGDWQLVLTPITLVPNSWYPPLADCDVLCLASGGGQQGPILAAAGARVTVFDNSPKQLDRDREVAEREGLEIQLVQGDMADLSEFANGSFDFIVHPVSNCFVPDLRPVWREAFRVLREGGTMIAGFCNPLLFCLDEDRKQAGELVLTHALPYSDLESISEADRARLFGAESPLEWSHTLESQIGGQLEAGFHLVGFYEDKWGTDDPANSLIDTICPSFIATRSLKPENR